MNSYAFEHNGKTFTPDGPITVPDVSAHNREIEAREIEWLKTGPDKCTLYVKIGTLKDRTMGYRLNRLARGHNPGLSTMLGDDVRIQTWLGTSVATHVYLGPRAYSGFGSSYRRAVSCQIFGVPYHGWFMESSGDYCRLTKSKKRGK